MATIGQQLLTPEAGWKRYDDRDTNISYVGTWTPSAVTGYYNNTNMDSNSTSSYYEFWFKGTKLRIIDGLASNRSADVKVTIDGVTESYSAYATATTRGVLVYEKTGLTNGFHKVVVKNNTSNYMTLDAIDIDEDGIFRPSYNKFLILSNDGLVKSKSNDVLKTSTSVPLMTSNNSSEGVVIYSSETSGYQAYKVFNQANGNDWSPLTTTNEYVGFEFNQPKIIYKYSVRRGTHTTMANSPKSWRFEGSNDGLVWDVLDAQNNQSWTSVSEEKTFNISNSKKYRRYRLFIIEGWSSVYYIGELLMFDKTIGNLINLTSSSEQNFINHGINKSTDISLTAQITKKVFIEQSSTTLGSGKVFSKTIDTTKTPIKKVTIK